MPPPPPVPVLILARARAQVTEGTLHARLLQFIEATDAQEAEHFTQEKGVSEGVRLPLYLAPGGTCTAGAGARGGAGASYGQLTAPAVQLKGGDVFALRLWTPIALNQS